MKRIIYIIAMFAVVVFAGCKRFPNLFSDEQVLAEVDGNTLYLYDIESIFTPGMLPEDSITLLDNYVDQWVKKKLKVAESEKIFKDSKNEADIESMVEEYRISLLTNKVDQYFVDTKIDTLFTDNQIEEYFQKHKAEFVLSKPIVKSRIVKVPDSYRQLPKFKELMNSSRSEDYQDFVDICTKNGFEMMEVGSWTDFSELLQMIPTVKDKNYDNMLTENKLFEFPTKGYTYFVKITARRLKGDYQPLESVRNMIQRVIFNERKQEIIRKYEDSLYNNAVAGKKIKVKNTK